MNDPEFPQRGEELERQQRRVWRWLLAAVQLAAVAALLARWLGWI